MAKKDLNKKPRVTENGEIDLSPERAFVVKRTGKQVAALQQKIKVTKWVLLGLLLFVIILYLLFIFFWRGGLDGEGGAGDDYGDFTVMLDPGSRNMISLSEDAEFKGATVMLPGTSAYDLWHCTRDWIPADIHDSATGGGHSSSEPSYLAYTFYLKNTSDEEIIYTYDLELIDKYIASKIDALDALRVMFIRNGEKTVWANPPVDGTPLEADTLQFSKEPYLMEQKDNVIAPQAIDKYTVVIWAEGTDPECINDIFTNKVKFQMNFDVQNKLKETSETEE